MKKIPHWCSFLINENSCLIFLLSRSIDELKEIILLLLLDRVFSVPQFRARSSPISPSVSLIINTGANSSSVIFLYQRISKSHKPFANHQNWLNYFFSTELSVIMIALEFTLCLISWVCSLIKHLKYTSKDVDHDERSNVVLTFHTCLYLAHRQNC